MSATVWLPQPAGQPDQWMRIGLPWWTFVSSVHLHLTLDPFDKGS